MTKLYPEMFVAPHPGDNVFRAVDASVAAVTANGGTILMTPQLMPWVGRLAMCKDTEGNVFGILQMESRF